MVNEPMSEIPGRARAGGFAQTSKIWLEAFGVKSNWLVESISRDCAGKDATFFQPAGVFHTF
jgi:hypothetical protein